MFLFRRIVRRKVKIIKRRIKRPSKDYLLKKELSRELVHQRLEHFNQFYKFKYNRVFIKNMKTRWGSCSSKKNLNFHYKIIDLAPDLADYLVVHELCHIGEFNHSTNFWSLVEKTMPDYKNQRIELKKTDLKSL